MLLVWYVDCIHITYFIFLMRNNPTCFVIYFVCFFFFQAEDGIRDLVRSRGLGDVYKRQGYPSVIGYTSAGDKVTFEIFRTPLPNIFIPDTCGKGEFAVSYTHLTLPTSDLV